MMALSSPAMTVAAAASPLRRSSLQRNRLQQRPSRFVARAALADVTEESFEAEVLQASSPVLVDVWASWCGPCMLMVPILEQIDAAYGDKLKVVKLEADSCPALVEKFKVYGLPTFLVFKDGKLVEGSQKEGVLNKGQLEELLVKSGISP